MTPGDLEEMVYSTRRRVSSLEGKIEELKAEIEELKENANSNKILKDPAEPPSDKADEVETIGSHEAWGELLKTVKEEMMSKPKSKWVEFELYTYGNQGSVFLQRDKISYFHKSLEHSGTTIHYDNEVVYVGEEPDEVMKSLEN